MWNEMFYNIVNLIIEKYWMGLYKTIDIYKY